MTVRLIGEHMEGDVRVRWWGDDVANTITIEHYQDPQVTIDKVAAVNADGAPTVDGLGKPIGEIPVVKAMEWARQRGIPWEKLLYSNEYDAELRSFLREHQRLAYISSTKFHTVQ